MITRHFLHLCLMIFILLGVLCSCTAMTDEPHPSGDACTKADELRAMRGIWVTASELSFEEDNEERYRQKIDEMFSLIAAQGISDVFAQVRPNCDALYASSFFEKSPAVSSLSFDVLSVLCDSAREHSVRLHAWINPYRVSSSSSLSELSPTSAAKKLSEQVPGSVFTVPGGTYLDPGCVEAQRLILNGVRELLERYTLAGIHIDDYFYPVDTADADEGCYSEYRQHGGALSLADFRRANVDCLVEGIYSLVRSTSEKLIFSISPCADMEKDRELYYADVERWCRGGYCDVLMPQIYFGFQNATMPFASCLNEWLACTQQLPLCPGLALYKQGKEDIYAGSGSEEWIDDSAVIEKQKALCAENGCGFCLFSYSYLAQGT